MDLRRTRRGGGRGGLRFSDVRNERRVSALIINCPEAARFNTPHRHDLREYVTWGYFQ